MKMQKKILSIIVFLFLSCNIFENSIKETGSLSIFVDNSSRTITPDIHITSYDISGSGPSSETFGPENSTSNSFVKSGLLLGEWTITVQGKNNSGDIVAEGSGVITLESGFDSSLTINISPLTGSGTFSILIDWPSGTLISPVINAQFGPSGGILSPLELSVSDGGATLTTTDYAMGYYTLIIDIFDGSSPRTSIVETVLIITSQNTSADFSLTADELGQCGASPVVFSVSEGEYSLPQSLTLTSATLGATIKYTNSGSIPTPSTGLEYTSPITINSSQTIKAISFADGYDNSTVTSAEYTITGSIPVPTVNLEEGLYYEVQSLDIIVPSGDYTVVYTTDGSEPVVNPLNGTIYSGVITLNTETEYSLKAMTFNNVNPDMVSDIITADYLITGVVSDPQFSVSGGTYNSNQILSLSTATTGTSIYYTVDGSEPSADNGILYSSAISLTNSLTVKAVAVKTDWISSVVISETYELKTLTPTFSVPEGSYTDPTFFVDFLCDTPGVSYLYTSDGTDPVEGSNGTAGASRFISSDVILKVIATKTGWSSSEIAIATYQPGSTITSPGEEAFIYQTPLLDFPSTVGAVNYHIMFSQDNSFSTILESDETLIVSEYQTYSTLVIGTSYYWKYRSYNGSSWSDWSDIRSFVKEGEIGEAYQGGIIFYLDGNGGGLIAAESDLSTGIQWYNGSYITCGASGTTIGTGEANTISIISVQGTGSYAAKLCYDLILNGYDDWFLPSKDELNQMYIYKDVIDLSSDYYWSSTEYSIEYAWKQAFYSGQQFYNYKSTSGTAVRAIRAF